MLHTVEERLGFLEANLERVQWAYRRACENGTPDPLVLLVDLSDPLGKTIIDGVASTLGMSANSTEVVITDSAPQNAIPTSIVAANRWKAYKLLREIQCKVLGIHPANPSVSPVVEELRSPAPAGRFFCLVWSGGKTVIDVPVESAPPKTQNVDPPVNPNEGSVMAAGALNKIKVEQLLNPLTNRIDQRLRNNLLQSMVRQLSGDDPASYRLTFPIVVDAANRPLQCVGLLAHRADRRLISLLNVFGITLVSSASHVFLLYGYATEAQWFRDAKRIVRWFPEQADMPEGIVH